MSQSTWDALQQRLVSMSTPQGKTNGEPEGEGGARKPVPTIVDVPPNSPPANPNDIYVPTFLVEKVSGSGFCGGRIGGAGSTKFCTSPCVFGTRNCRFPSHSVKAILDAPAYYICTVKPGSAFTQPCVIEPPGGFSDLIKDAMNGKRRMGEWNDLFTVLNGFPDDLSETDQVQNISKVGRTVTIGLTPAKTRLRMDSDELASDMLHIADSDSWAAGTSDKLNTVLIDDNMPPDLEFIVHVHTNWNFLTSSIIRQAAETEAVDSSIRSLIEEIDLKVLRATAIIGMTPSDAPALTLWNCIKEHGLMMDGLQELVRGTAEKSRVDYLEVDAKVITIRAMLDNNLLPILNDLADKHQAMVERESVGDPIQVRLERCESRIGDMIRVMATQEATSTRGSNRNEAAETGPNEEVVALTHKVGTLLDIVSSLSKQVESLKSELNTETITFGGYAFQTKESYENFLKVHVGSNHWGFCYDFISIFELHNDQNRTSDASLQSNHLIGKVGYTDLQSARIDNSFQTLIPVVFGAEQDLKDPSKKMAKLVSMATWEHPTSQSGVKEDIKVFFESHTVSLISQIERHYGIGTRASLFFEGLINNTVTFWNALEAWITRFEKDLTAQGGGDNPKVHKESVWKLICWMLHAMFKEMLKRRQPGGIYPSFSTGIKVRTEDELREKCASILHGTLAAHKFMKELVNDGFVRHSIFSSTMDEYLLKNKAAQVSLVELQEKVKELMGLVTGQQRLIDRLLGEKGVEKAEGKKKAK